MSEYRRILISIDPAHAQRPVAPALRRLVDFNHAEITLLHVVEAQPWVGRARHSLRLLTELDILAHQRFRGARLTRRIEWGRPADCILNVLRTDRLDAVLLTAAGASRGRDPLGPVASEVIAEAPCPVLLEWSASPQVNQACVQPVCCAVEPDGNEERVLREATWAAERCAVPMIPFCTAYDAAATKATLRRHNAGLLVAGGSRDVLLGAENECPVLYAGPARTVSRTQQTFAVRRSA
jgi:nucleotide-binding universal stress UspA family protein